MRKLAAVATVCALTVGCAVDDPGGETDGAGPTNSMTTNSTTADSAGNPWDLPLEQRPALFDPCAEIPDSALAEAGFTPEQLDHEFTTHEPGELMSCKWDNDEISLSVISSWKSRSETAVGESLVDVGPTTIEGHPGIRMLDATDTESPSTLRALFHSDRGSILVSTLQHTTLREFRGQRFVPIQHVFDVTVRPIIRVIPEGDHP